MTDQNSSRPGVQVISRAANILRALEGQPNGLSLGAIAEEVSLARSTVQRIVYALESERLVIAATPKSGVRLGPGLVSLGSAAKANIDRVILPYMKSLSREIDETVDLSVQDGNMMIFIEHVIEVTQRLRAVSAVGNTFPLYSCANGKAILATMDDESVKNILPQSFSKLTPSTIKNSKKLFAELNDIRESGIAFDREEHAEGICAVGAAIADPYGRNIAISIPVPSVRFYKNEKIFSIMLLKYCKKIESALGKSSN